MDSMPHEEIDLVKIEIETEFENALSAEEETYDITEDNNVLDEETVAYYKHLCEDSFKIYRFVIQDEKFFNIENGEYYSATGFNAKISGSFPMFQSGVNKDNTIKVKFGKAANAFLNGDFYEGLRADRKYFDSSKPTGFINDTPNGVYVNVYRKSGEGFKKGDCTPFLELLNVLFEEKEDQQLMLKIMKWVTMYAGNPRKRLTFAPFITGIEGNGKSTIVAILAQLIGREYVSAPSAKALDSEFNGFMVGKFLVNIDELPYTGKNDYAERLKEWITQPYISIRQMKTDAYQAQNIGNFFITSNHASALMQSAENTRFCNFKTRFKNQEEFLAYFGGYAAKNKWYADLYDWLENKSGFAIVNWYLKNKVDFDGFVGTSRAPKTKQHDFLLGEQEDSYIISLREAIEETGEVFTKSDIVEALKSLGHKNIPPKIFNEKLVRLKYWNEGSTYNRVFRIKDLSLKGKSCRLYAPEHMSQEQIESIYKEVLRERND